MTASSFNREPLHRQLAVHLRADIRKNYRPGDKLPPESKLAKEMGVSVLTIREALCSLDQEGLISRHRGRGTFVLDQGERQHVAVLVGLDILSPSVSVYFKLLTSNLRDFLEAKGEKVRIYFGRNAPDDQSTEFRSEAFFEDLEAGRVKSVAAINLPAFGSWMAEVSRQKLPLAGVGDYFPYSIDTDYDALVSEAVAYLANRGCRKIAMVGFGGEKPVDIESNPLVRRFMLEMRSRDLEVRPNWISGNIHQARKAAGWDAFREIWSSSKEKPDGLLVSDNMLFRDVMVAIREMDLRVPDDLLVATHAVKHDDFYYMRPVAKFEVDPRAHAEVLSELLLAQMRGEEIPRPHRHMRPELIDNHSVESKRKTVAR